MVPRNIRSPGEGKTGYLLVQSYKTGDYYCLSRGCSIMFGMEHARNMIAGNKNNNTTTTSHTGTSYVPGMHERWEAESGI